MKELLVEPPEVVGLILLTVGSTRNVEVVVVADYVEIVACSYMINAERIGIGGKVSPLDQRVAHSAGCGGAT